MFKSKPFSSSQRRHRWFAAGLPHLPCHPRILIDSRIDIFFASRRLLYGTEKIEAKSFICIKGGPKY